MPQLLAGKVTGREELRFTKQKTMTQSFHVLSAPAVCYALRCLEPRRSEHRRAILGVTCRFQGFGGYGWREGLHCCTKRMRLRGLLGHLQKCFGSCPERVPRHEKDPGAHVIRLSHPFVDVALGALQGSATLLSASTSWQQAWKLKSWWGC